MISASAHVPWIDMILSRYLSHEFLVLLSKMERSLNVGNFDKSHLFSISFSMEGSLLSNRS